VGAQSEVENSNTQASHLIRMGIGLKEPVSAIQICFGQLLRVIPQGSEVCRFS